jgi:hypothetical protein
MATLSALLIAPADSFNPLPLQIRRLLTKFVCAGGSYQTPNKTNFCASIPQGVECVQPGYRASGETILAP